MSEWFAYGSDIRGWVFVGGDSFWRLTLLLRCLFVVTSSRFFFFWDVKVFRVFGGCVCVAMSLFLLICLLFAPIAYHVYRITYCVLVSGGPIIFASRSGVGVYLQSCLT